MENVDGAKYRNGSLQTTCSRLESAKIHLTAAGAGVTIETSGKRMPTLFKLAAKVFSHSTSSKTVIIRSIQTDQRFQTYSGVGREHTLAK